MAQSEQDLSNSGFGEKLINFGKKAFLGGLLIIGADALIDNVTEAPELFHDSVEIIGVIGVLGGLTLAGVGIYSVEIEPQEEK